MEPPPNQTLAALPREALKEKLDIGKKKKKKQAAKGYGVTSEALIKAFILVELPELTLDSPKYTEAQNQLAKVEGAIKTEKVW